MEIIPETDKSALSDPDAPAARTVELDSSSSVREPLSVELLEDKVLLASDAAGVESPSPADAVSTEPAPLVAAAVADSAAVDVVVPTEVLGPTETGAVSHAAASEAHLDTVEVPREAIERPGPGEGQAIERRADELGEKEWGRNEFGVATIESKGSRLGEHDSGELHSFVGTPSSPIDVSGSKAVGTESELTEPTLDERVLQELGRERPAPELANSLAEETAIAPLLHETSAAETQATLNVSEHRESVVAAPRADQIHLGDFANESANAERVDAESLSVPTRSNSDEASERLPEAPAAHDAIFARGDGVEAVLDEGMSNLKTS